MKLNKKYSIAFVCLFFIKMVNADPINVKIINQYETAVGALTIFDGEKNVSVETKKDGSCTIDLGQIDSLVFTADKYESVKMSVKDIKENSIISLHKKFTWKDLFNPMFYIIYGGLWFLLFIIFAETGLFAGFFLPGDSLLFVAGIYSNNLGHEFLKLVGMGGLQNEWADLIIIIGLVILAGIFGNFIGYWFGRKIGPAMFSWKDNLLFKKKYLFQAKDFYDKHGGGAIVVARFVPIIRTFAPIISGIVQMPKAKFSFYNIVGCVAWVASMILGGHFLQQWILSEFGFNLKDHLEVIVIGIILVSTLPILIKLFFAKSNKQPQ